MDIMFFGLMAVIMVFIIYKNLSLFKRMKHNNQYIECYKAMLNNDEGAYELIKNTIENEPLSEFRHKLKIFQLFCEVNNDNNCLDEIDLKEIYYDKGQLNKQKATLNSDSFMWIMMVMAKANKAGRLEIIDSLNEKVMNLEEMSNRLEYKMVEYLAKTFKKEEGSLQFFKDLLDGNAYMYAHDKQMIGLYKRMAAVMLDINDEEYDEFYREDLRNFSTTLIGLNFMKDIGNYDKYHENTEVVEENKE